jgi:hypothetical protein
VDSAHQPIGVGRKQSEQPRYVFGIALIDDMMLRSRSFIRSVRLKVSGDKLVSVVKLSLQRLPNKTAAT